MRKIAVKFLFFNDEVCGRCKTTDDFLDEALKEFRQKHTDVEITVKRKKLKKEHIKKSPTILLDNTDLESYLSPNFIQKSDNCQDCSCLVGQPVSCRTYGDNENLSKEQILEALEKHLKSKGVGIFEGPKDNSLGTKSSLTLKTRTGTFGRFPSLLKNNYGIENNKNSGDCSYPSLPF